MKLRCQVEQLLNPDAFWTLQDRKGKILCGPFRDAPMICSTCSGQKKKYLEFFFSKSLSPSEFLISLDKLFVSQQ